MDASNIASGSLAVAPAMDATETVLMCSVGRNDNHRTFTAAPEGSPLVWGMSQGNAVSKDLCPGMKMVVLAPTAIAAQNIHRYEEEWQVLPFVKDTSGCVIAVAEIESIEYDASGKKGMALWPTSTKKYEFIIKFSRVARTPWWGKQSMLCALGKSVGDRVFGACKVELPVGHDMLAKFDRALADPELRVDNTHHLPPYWRERRCVVYKKRAAADVGPDSDSDGDAIAAVPKRARVEAVVADE